VKYNISLCYSFLYLLTREQLYKDAQVLLARSTSSIQCSPDRLAWYARILQEARKDGDRCSDSELLTCPEIGLAHARMMSCMEAGVIREFPVSLLLRNRLRFNYSAYQACPTCRTRGFNGHLAREISGFNGGAAGDTFSLHIRAAQIIKVLPIVINGCHAIRFRKNRAEGIPGKKAVALSLFHSNGYVVIISFLSIYLTYCNTSRRRSGISIHAV